MKNDTILLVVFGLATVVACSSVTAPPSAPGPPFDWAYDPAAERAPDSGPILPVVVDLSGLPRLLGAPSPSEVHRPGSRPELPISREEADRLRAAALDAEPHPEVAQVAGVGVRAPIPLRGFESMDFPSAGAAFVPPDPELAVGPAHVIAVTNIAFEIYDPLGLGVSGGPISFAALFGTTTGCTNLFDPNVVYDEQLDRFVLGVDANGTGYCVAMSQGPNPVGPWNVYSFATVAAGSGEFFDYPHAGAGDLALYMGANIFDASMAFLRGDVWAIDKQAMAGGLALPFPVRQTTGSESTPQPMNAHGWAQATWPSIGPHYVVTDGPYDGNQFGVWSWTDPFGANTFSNLGLVDLAVATGVSASYPVDAPQLGNPVNIQDNDWRVLDAEYRNGRVWMTHSLSMNPGAGAVDAVRWAELDPTVPAVVQAGIVVSQDAYRLFPDLAVNHCDDMTLGYTKTSSAMIPAVWVTGRLGTDPPGTVQAEAAVRNGDIPYSTWETGPYRWGDYTGATSGPDGDTTWYLGEYSKAIGPPSPLANWGTFVGVFSTGCPTLGDLQLTKDNGVAQVAPGSPVSYTLTVTNLGPAGLVGAQLIDSFPAALGTVSWTCTPQTGPPASSCSALSGTGALSLRLDLEAGAVVTVVATGTLSPSATGTLSNTATVTAPGSMDPNPVNNTAMDVDAVLPAADLAITKTDGLALVVPGTAVTYGLTVTNAGPLNVVGATVTDVLPSTLQGATWTCVGQAGTPASSCTNPSGAGSVSELVNIDVGAAVSIAISATVDPSAVGTLVNTSTVAVPAGWVDPVPANDASTDSDALTPVADLGVRVTDGSCYVLPGSSTSYVVTVTNDGPSDAPAAVVADSPPADLTVTSWSCSAAGGATCGASSGAGALSDGPGLVAGWSVTYTVQGTVASSATGILRYTVGASPGSGVVDPAPANDSGWDDSALELPIFCDGFESGDTTAW